MITYSFKIKTTPTLIQKIEHSLNVTRLVYNLAKEVKEEAYKKGVKMTNYDIQKQLSPLRKEFNWIKSVSSHSLQKTIERLDNNYKNFYRGAGYPKWALKKKWKSIEFRACNVSLFKDQSLVITSIGKVKIFQSREVKGIIKTASIVKKSDGYYLNIVTDHQIQKCDNQAEVGIDRGIKYLAVTSDGQYFENIKTTDKYSKKLRIKQRALSRKKRLSKNWYKQVGAIQKLYLKISRIREDYVHKVSRELANNYQTVYLENLNTCSMVKNNKLSKAISDVSWYKLEQFLSYKTNVIKVNPAYTSQDCSNCGNRDKMNRKSQSDFKCTSCGFEMNADENASFNILERGQSLLSLNVKQ